jgi:hypothetical protein
MVPLISEHESRNVRKRVQLPCLLLGAIVSVDLYAVRSKFVIVVGIGKEIRSEIVENIVTDEDVRRMAAWRALFLANTDTIE